MEQTNFQRACALEKHIDQIINELSYLNEELFNTASCELEKLPIGYSSIQDAIEKASALFNLIEQTMKVQAYFVDKELTMDCALNEAKEAILDAAFKHI